MKCVVVIEDESDIRDSLVYNLSREGYRAQGADAGDTGLALIRAEQPAVVLLDLMVPGLDGLEVCRIIRSDPDLQGCRIIMITARDEETDVVLGLGIGADDYVTKPFRVREVLARIRAVLNRGPLKTGAERPERVRHGPLIIDRGRHEVLVDDRPVNLTATEFRILAFLGQNEGRVFTRDALLNHAIGEHAFVIDRNIDVHIRAIRKKLDHPHAFIRTVRGVGYRFVAPRS
ncbi:MAG: response regulator [Opitutales bacterium]